MRRPAESQYPAAVLTRRAWPIHAYIGPNGSGKSLAAVMDSMVSLAAGRPVLSTVRLLDWTAEPEIRTSHNGGEDREIYPEHPLYERLTDWRQVMEAERCDILLDEVTGVASSREHTGLPAAVANLLVQLRRRDVVLRWTSPSWLRADLIIRECTQAVTVAQGSRPERRLHDGRMWHRNRRFSWKTYDAASFEEYSLSASEKAKVLCSQRFWAPGKDVLHAYDTLDAVDTITSVTDAGRCVDCGGQRRAPQCSCAAYVERQAASKSARPQAKRGRTDLGLTAVLDLDHEHADAG